MTSENIDMIEASIARDRATVTPGIDRAARPGAARFLTEASDDRSGDGAILGVKARIDLLIDFVRHFRQKAQAARHIFRAVAIRPGNHKRGKLVPPAAIPRRMEHPRLHSRQAQVHTGY